MYFSKFEIKATSCPQTFAGPIMVANTFGWDEKATYTKTFVTTKVPLRHLNRLMVFMATQN